jgi:hypothetical protein
MVLKMVPDASDGSLRNVVKVMQTEQGPSLFVAAVQPTGLVVIEPSKPIRVMLQRHEVLANDHK